MAVRVRELSEWMIGNPLVMFDTGQPDVPLTALETAATGRQVLWIFRNNLCKWNVPHVLDKKVMKQLKFNSRTPSVMNRMLDTGKANIMAARLEGRRRESDEWAMAQNISHGDICHWSGGGIKMFALDTDDRQQLRGVVWDLMIVPT
jgi:hypothetical protein